MKNVAFIFPGQGAQSIGMGKDLFENSPEARKVFEKADKVLGRCLSKICFEGPEEDLKLTANTQPAILTVSVAALEALKNKLSIKPSFVAGHSLGEYVALYAAGALDQESVFKIIAKRAELMNEAATKTSGSMAAVLGLSQEKIEEALKPLQDEGLISVANFNTPEQTVITGEVELINKAVDVMKQAGAKRVIPLAVSGAFHSGLMKDASVEFATFVNTFDVKDSNIPVITNTDANPTTSGEEFKEKMPTQIYSSVHWVQTIQKMVDSGVDTFIEIGPGKVLAGLNKKISSDVTTYNVYDMASLAATVEALKTAQTV